MVEMENTNIENVWPNWHVESRIGQGGFGIVYKVKKELFGDITWSAVKVVSIPNDPAEIKDMSASGLDEESIREYYQESVKQLINEIRLMEKMKSASHIVLIEDYEVVEEKERMGWKIYIRMELLTNLQDVIKAGKMDTQGVVKMAEDVLTGLEFCHEVNLLHRDIKPGNIFVSEFGEYKIGDFGISREVERSSSTLSQKGTKSYMAPEIIRMEHYDQTVDIYALGLTMYEICNHGRMPFLPPYPEKYFPIDREKAILQRLTGQPFPEIEGIGALNKVILKACAFDPTNRYQSAAEMKEALLKLGEDAESDTSAEEEYEDEQEKEQSEKDSVGNLEKEQSEKEAVNNRESKTAAATDDTDRTMEIGSDSLKQLHDVLNKLKKEEKESARTEKSASENKASKNKTSENNSDRKHASKNEETSDLHDDGQDKKEKTAAKNRTESLQSSCPTCHSRSYRMFKNGYFCPKCNQIHLTSNLNNQDDRALRACLKFNRTMDQYKEVKDSERAGNLSDKDVFSGKIKDYLALYQEMAKDCPDSPQLYLRMALCHMDNQNKKLAADCLQYALALEKEDASIYLGFAELEGEYKYHCKEAERYLEQGFPLMKKGSYSLERTENRYFRQYAMICHELSKRPDLVGPAEVEKKEQRAFENLLKYRDMGNMAERSECETFMCRFGIGEGYSQPLVEKIVQKYCSRVLEPDLEQKLRQELKQTLSENEKILLYAAPSFGGKNRPKGIVLTGNKLYYPSKNIKAYLPLPYINMSANKCKISNNGKKLQIDETLITDSSMDHDDEIQEFLKETGLESLVPEDGEKKVYNTVITVGPEAEMIKEILLEIQQIFTL